MIKKNWAEAFYWPLLYKVEKSLVSYYLIHSLLYKNVVLRQIWINNGPITFKIYIMLYGTLEKLGYIYI
jgi:hypothetical protein